MQAVLGYNDGLGFKGRVVTTRHNCANPEERQRILRDHADTTRALDVRAAFVVLELSL